MKVKGLNIFALGPIFVTLFILLIVTPASNANAKSQHGLRGLQGVEGVISWLKFSTGAQEFVEANPLKHDGLIRGTSSRCQLELRPYKDGFVVQFSYQDPQENSLSPETAKVISSLAILSLTNQAKLKGSKILDDGVVIKYQSPRTHRLVIQSNPRGLFTNAYYYPDTKQSRHLNCKFEVPDLSI